MASTSSPSLHALAERWWVELLWWVFVAVNVWGILVLKDWATVPFHFIWIGLSLIFGWRLWSLVGTLSALGLVIAVTGATMFVDVMKGVQAPDELTEIPLMAAVFGAMVLYVRRSERVQAETERVSEHNMALLEENRRLVQNASHMLRTPLTIALGYAELLQRTTTDPRSADDAQAVVDELVRLKKITDRLLRLATRDQPDFVRLGRTPVPQLLEEVVGRWTATHPQVRLAGVAGTAGDTVLLIDAEQIGEALDELISNAVRHGAGARVEVSCRLEDDWQVLRVADDGPGVPAELADTLFERFSSIGRTDRQGFGLGLAIVKAVAEAHGGSVQFTDEPGSLGAGFEIRLPACDEAQVASSPTVEVAEPAR